MTAYTFTFKPAANDFEDAEYTLDQFPAFGIQDCRSYGGGYCVTETGYDDPADEDTMWIQHYDSKPFRSLKAAKEFCIAKATGQA